MLGRNAMQINVWETEAEPESVSNFDKVERKDFRGSKAKGQSLSKTLNTHNGSNKISKNSYTNTEVKYESDNQAPQIIKNYNSSLLSNLFNKNNVKTIQQENIHVEIPIIDFTEEEKQSEITITEVVNEHGCSDVGNVDFFERVSRCADREKRSSDVLSSSVSSYMGDFVVHEARDWCANLHASQRYRYFCRSAWQLFI